MNLFKRCDNRLDFVQARARHLLITYHFGHVQYSRMLAMSLEMLESHRKSAKLDSEMALR